MTTVTRAGTLLMLGGVLALATPPGSAGAAGPDYAMLDAMAERAYRCEQASEAEYWSGEPQRMVAALDSRLSCLEEIAATLAEEFYPPGAFGPGGMRARLDDLEGQTSRLFGAIHTRPLSCDGAKGPCGPIYDVWARENTVAAVRSAVDAMIERLKDQSPMHAP